MDTYSFCSDIGEPLQRKNISSIYFFQDHCSTFDLEIVISVELKIIKFQYQF